MFDRVRSRIREFVVAPADPRPLAIFRIGIALALIGEAAAVAPGLQDYYGPIGLIQAPIAEALVHWSLPSLRSLSRTLSFTGLTAAGTVHLVFATYVVALHLLLLGCGTRIAAMVTWILFLMLKKAGSASAYGAYEFAHIALFYCAVLPVGSALSIDAIRRPARPSPLTRVGLRLLQLHLCIVYLSSGIEKSAGQQWWNGEAIWRALMRPGHAWVDFSWLAYHPLLARIAAWGTLALETGYGLFVWPRRTRRFWIAAVVGLHLAIAAALGLFFFSAVMIVFNVSAFLISAEPAATVSEGSFARAEPGISHPRAGCPTAGPP